jgi:hypothetical protein
LTLDLRRHQMRIEASNNLTNPKKNIRFEFSSAKHVG